jgi:L-2-hydroxyglutarate oxidase LhgO
MAGREVIILEALEAFGTQTSARNSEVLHAGLYYPADWLKTQLCIAGRPQVEALADAHGVPWKRIGKLVVATHDDERPALEALHKKALVNGASGVQLIDAEQARRMEPALTPDLAAALWSPHTGIIDSHALMLALLGDAQRHGAMLALKSSVRSIERGPQGLIVDVACDPPIRLCADIVINAAGHGAVALGGAMNAPKRHHTPMAHICKGNYFSLRGRAPFSHLIYPVASAHVLGVHLTLDLGGQARFGPDSEWLDEGTARAALAAAEGHGAATEALQVSPRRAPAFEAAVRRFWPGLPGDALQPAFAGLRPKIHGHDEPLADFCIQGEAVHGVPGLVNLYGIESPGLTSCLALADATLTQALR